LWAASAQISINFFSGLCITALGDTVTHFIMARTKREQRISVRVAGPLRDELEAEAVQDGRPLADYVRRLLIDAVAARMVQNEQSTAGA
jgi:hypothetical protein